MASYLPHSLGPGSSHSRLGFTSTVRPQHSKEDELGMLGKEKIRFIVLSLPGFQCRENAKLRTNRPATEPAKVRARCEGREY